MNPRMTDWDVTWNAISLGTVDKVDPSGLKLILKEIKRGTTGNMTLGHFVVGIEGSIKVQCKDVTLTLLQNLCPWKATAQPLMPTTMNADLYSYAQLLNLHPHDVPAATLTEDVNFPKAVPISVLPLSRDGNNEDMYEVEFYIYPDRTQITAATPKPVYGYVGSTAP